MVVNLVAPAQGMKKWPMQMPAVVQAALLPMLKVPMPMLVMMVGVSATLWDFVTLGMVSGFSLTGMGW